MKEDLISEASAESRVLLQFLQIPPKPPAPGEEFAPFSPSPRILRCFLSGGDTNEAPHESLSEGKTGELVAFSSSLADLRVQRGKDTAEPGSQAIGDGTRGPRFKSWLLHFQARRI